MTGQPLLPSSLEACLPERVMAELYELSRGGRVCAQDINEIRLRAARPMSVTCRGRNIALALTLLPSELDDCVTRLCHGSVYAHGDTIRAGYIRADGGVRVGVCGTLAADGRAVSEITSLNIRVPHMIRGVCDRVLALCTEPTRIRSLLIYSPPGVGKTTLLRDLAARLGTERRVAIIDTRGELYIEQMFADTLCDVLVGYPRAQGIEIATRTLSPEVLICDELGDADEARQILATVSAGVPIIASAHASTVGELLARPNIRMLHESRVFSGYVGISRESINGRLTRSFCCDFTEWEDIA